MEKEKNQYYDETEILFEDYRKNRIEYYREVFKKHDRLLLSQISRIPDEWNDKASDITITDESRRRLCDMKKYKSWELRLEIFFMYYLVDVENYFISVLNYRSLGTEEMREALDSVNSILCETGSNLIDFSYLLLSVAKRSVSDLYYLLAAYKRFYYGKPFNFIADFEKLLAEISCIFDRYVHFSELTSAIYETGLKMDKYFIKSSNYSGWRLNDAVLRQNEKNMEDGGGTIADLARLLPAAYSLKIRMKKDHDFLGFYYNRESGKLFRLNYVKETMLKKVESSSMDSESFHKFERMRTSFEKIKRHYDMSSLENFGPENMPYEKLVEFIYKACKLLEFHYLRNSKAELLQKLRNDMLIYIEKEYHRIINIQAR